MENKKINVSLSLGIVVITFLAIFYILISSFYSRRLNDFKECAAILKQKNNSIRILSYQLAAQMKENEDLKKTLTETSNGLDVLRKNLSQQTPAAGPAKASPAAK